MKTEKLLMSASGDYETPLTQCVNLDPTSYLCATSTDIKDDDSGLEEMDEGGDL